MAIVQVSRIQHRKGLQENLPQLAGAELGWSIDERRLFIGNGTLEEGAPVIGNTEILTEFSDILAFQTTYTYKGAAAGYIVQTGPSAGTPITQSLQSWLDQWASVKDFGAVGDGVTDDTEAINRALYQLYCREVNPQIRRSLFFPAGVYLVNSTIIIPPFATLYGEGADNSIIRMVTGDDSASRAYVARTGDSLQQTGVNIGNNGAIVPQYVTVDNLAFESLDPDIDIFLFEDVTECSFTNVGFRGPLVEADLNTDTYGTSCVTFIGTASLIPSSIRIDKCAFSGATYAVNTLYQTKGITVSNSDIDTFYQGIVLGDGVLVNGGPTGFRIIGNTFDNIYEEGIYFGNISLNATSQNIFYDVGNHFNGASAPQTAIIAFVGANNVSISDLFERNDSFAAVEPRINLGNVQNIGMVNGRELLLGTYGIESGNYVVATNNVANQTLFTVDYNTVPGGFVKYTITRDTGVRVGTFRFTAEGGATVSYDDDYTQNENVGVTLTASQSGDTITIKYTTTNTGLNGTIRYSLSYFNA